MNATKIHWRLLDTDSGDGLIPSGDKQATTWTNVAQVLWGHVGHIELREICSRCRYAVLNVNYCDRCGSDISSVMDISIGHKTIGSCPMAYYLWEALLKKTSGCRLTLPNPLWHNQFDDVNAIDMTRVILPTVCWCPEFIYHMSLCNHHVRFKL